MNTLQTLATALTLAALPACQGGKPTQYWPDQDMDGYGENSSDYMQNAFALGSTVYPEVSCDADELPAKNLDGKTAICVTREEIKKYALKPLAPQSGDCDDSKAEINPGAEEIFDERDNNCDGLVDMDPAPKSLDLPYEKISVDGKAMFANDPTSWEQMLTEFGNMSSWGAGNALRAEAAYGFKPDAGFLKDPTAQDRLYAWALPFIQDRVKNASPSARASLQDELESAATYASTMDVDAETAYLRDLQARDCTDIYRHSPYSDLGQDEKTSCQQFFVHYGPDAPWKKAIAQARTRGQNLEYDAEPFIFIDEPKATEHRALQARLYRRVANGEVTKEDLQKWIARVRTDLAPALGVVEQ